MVPYSSLPLLSSTRLFLQLYMMFYRTRFNIPGWYRYRRKDKILPTFLQKDNCRGGGIILCPKRYTLTKLSYTPITSQTRFQKRQVLESGNMDSEIDNVEDCRPWTPISIEVAGRIHT
jgi:hypothetical protein